MTSRIDGRWAPACYGSSSEAAPTTHLHVEDRRAGRAAPADGVLDRADQRRWGLHPQRRREGPADRTATVSPEDLADEFFMLRVRIDGDMLTTGQLRVLAALSGEFARGTADLTDRANLQYHWVRPEDVREIVDRLQAAGLRTSAAPGDCSRVVLGSPVAGIIAGEPLDLRDTLRQVRAAYLGDPSLWGLPRKYRTSISWLPDCTPEINDVAFVGVVHPDLGPGLDLRVGGGLSVAPRLAVRLGAFVAPGRVPQVWLGLTRLFRDHGQGVLGRRARMKYLVDEWGARRLRDVLETEYLGYRLPDGPAAPVPDHVMDHLGVHDQHDGRKCVGFTAVAGRVSGKALAVAADAAQQAGSDRLRFTIQQKLLVFDVATDRVGALVDRLATVGLYAEPSPWRRSVMACTGLEFCKLAVVETKQRAHDLVAELEQRLTDPALERPISVHLNGCPNSCARVQTADIGLKGQLVTRCGAQVEGFQVLLGGGLGVDAGLGRTVRGLTVAASELGDYVERVVRRYLDDRDEGERFAQWAQRADEEQLS